MLPPPKWAPGSPAPFGYQLQVCRRSGLGALVAAWEPAVDAAPTGVHACAGSFATQNGAPRDAGAPPALPFTPVVVLVTGLAPDARYAVQLRA